MKIKVAIDKNRINSLIKKIQDFGDQSINVVEKETEDAANNIATRARANAQAYPQGVRDAIGNITAQELTPTYWTIGVQRVPIAAYLEFGTGAFVEIQPEWKDLAMQFYVNGKGTIKPHPYLYPAYHEESEKYITNLRKALKSLKLKNQ